MFAASRRVPTIINSRFSSIAARRTFAADATPTPPTPPPAKKSGAGLFQRISSFFVGAGLTALVTQFYIFKELTEGNNQMIASQKEIEKRLAKLEK